MTELLKFQSADGSVLVEVDPAPGYQPTAGARDRVVDAALTLEDSLEKIAPMIRVIGSHLSAIDPDELKVEFGLKLTVEAGAIIAKTGVEGHFTVSATFHRSVATQLATG